MSNLTCYQAKPILLLSAIFVLMLAPLESSAQPRRRSSQHQHFHPGSQMVVNVKDFKPAADGRTDDTSAFAAALKKLAEHSGGTLTIPQGTYVVGNLKVDSGISLRGIGPAALVVLLKAPKAANILDLSAALIQGERSTLHDVSIENITLRGRSVEDGFAEHIHNVSAIGVSRLTISHVVFEAFQGDGLYLGSRLQHENLVHNFDVEIQASSFDGVNQKNRNGISVIDCSRCIFDHNEFSNIGQPNMPGAFDIEPNERDDVLRDIQITNNTITNNHGNVGSICVVAMVPDSPAPQGILIQNNQIRGSKNGITILSRGEWSSERTASLEKPLIIQRNLVQDTDHALVLDGVGGISVLNNDISESRLGLLMGYSFGIRDIYFANNRLQHVGRDSGHGIVLTGPIESLTFDGNTFIDAGSNRSDGSAIHFSKGQATHLTFKTNIFSSPSGQSRMAITSAPVASFRPETNTWTGNTLKDGIQAGSLPHR